MAANSIRHPWCLVGLTLMTVGLSAVPATGHEAELDRRIDELICVLAHRESNTGDRLEQTRAAIKRLTAIGKPAVPKLLDAILGPNDNAVAYAGLALKGIPAAEALGPVKDRWDRLGTTDRWKLVRHFSRLDFPTTARFVLDSLKNKDETIRSQAWAFVIEHRENPLVKPARELYLQALAGKETPRLRWELLVDFTVFDARREADILIELLKPESWAAKGEGRVPPPGHTPPWWPDGRDLVVTVLGARKMPQSAPAMLKVLMEKGAGRAYLGHLIIPLLGEFGEQTAIPELKRVLGNKPEELERTLWEAKSLQAQAARSLWQLGDRAGRPLILEMMKSKHWGDRRFATETVARHGDRRDVEMLGKVLDDEDWGVLKAACQGLERITGVVNRAPGWVVTTEHDAPLWKEWLRKGRRGGS